MTQWETNQYYSFNDTNAGCVRIATSLLNSYSLTRGCLDTLGNKLLNQLEFGFFEQGFDIITQNESGRDIFFLCSGLIDVLVNDLIVVQMTSPTLVGDKGIVSLNSQRAATIRISGKEQALVIKIPMESFIRDFKSAKVDDKSFDQEKNIFENVFGAIQQRLFEYIYLQKSLWEQASNTINSLNKQILAKQLDNKKDPGWSPDTWQLAQSYLKTQYNVSWPENIPVNVMTFHAFSKKILDRKYPNTSKPEILTRKTLEWRNLLSAVCERISKSLPDTKMPIAPLNLELFNPNIYRMRLMGLQKQIEKRYANNTVKAKSDSGKSSKDYFGKGERSSVFALSQYLAEFQKKYIVKNQFRLLAQISQKCALIAAECENNFNDSVIKMQKFLDEVKSRNLTLDTSNDKSKTDPVKTQLWIAALVRGVSHFRDTSKTVEKQTLGQIKFSQKTYPNFVSLLRAHRVRFTKDQMDQAFNGIVDDLHFHAGLLSNDMVNTLFHICVIEKGDNVSEEHIQQSYWFPIAKDIILQHNGNRVFNLQIGAAFGGEAYTSSKSNENSDADTTGFSLTSEQDSIVFVLPPAVLPWTRNRNPSAPEFVTKYLPLMQWLLDRTIEQFLDFLSHRDRIIDECQELKNSIIRSKKIEKFEQRPLKLPKDDLYKIINWLNSHLNMKLDPSSNIVSNQLSKKIYNFYVLSVKKEFPGYSVEQCGNQAYTKWRNLLMEIVDQVPALNKLVGVLPGRETRPVFNILVKQLTPLISPVIKEIWEKQNPITSGKPGLNLMSILHPEKHESIGYAIILYEKILGVLSKNTRNLIIEIEAHQKTLSELIDEHSGDDATSDKGGKQVDIILESAQQLVNNLKNISK